MKLKCDSHERRIKILKGRRAVHNSDGSPCDTQTWHMGPNTVNERTGHKPYQTGHINSLGS